MDSIDVKIKSAPVVTPKKPAEIRPDLSKPIEVKEEMEVVLNGKRCMLAVDPDTGKLTAYPLLPPEGTWQLILINIHSSLFIKLRE